MTTRAKKYFDTDMAIERAERNRKSAPLRVSPLEITFRFANMSGWDSSRHNPVRNGLDMCTDYINRDYESN